MRATPRAKGDLAASQAHTPAAPHLARSMVRDLAASLRAVQRYGGGLCVQWSAGEVGLLGQGRKPAV